MPEKQYIRVLSIAGSDSGGGAGIQADIKTITALGAYAATAITALTAQNTQGVMGIYPIEPSFVAQQIEAVLSDIGADAIKIGMLHSASLIDTVIELLRRYPHIPIILDPVMVAQSGDTLLEHDAIDALIRLIPMAEIITPNIQEAEILSGTSWEPNIDLSVWGRALIQLGTQAVVLKGGHIPPTPHTSTCNDILYYEGKEHILEGALVSTHNNHGTGCTLSSALATYRAQGNSIYDSCILAKKYISSAIASGASYRIGKGHGPVHHGVTIYP